MVGYSLIGLYVPEDKSPANVKNADAAVVELRKYLKKQARRHASPARR